MKAGDTFRFRSKETHLWMVISDPEADSSRVLIVNMTTFRPDKEQTCLLNPGDHECVEHNSCINYAESRVYSNAHLDDPLARDRIVLYSELRSEILAMVREGAARSTRMKLEHGSILIDQELIE